MSFDAEQHNGSAGHTSRRQPKQCHREDNSFEREIRANIQEMQEGIRTALERLDQAQRGSLSLRARRSLDSFLESGQELVKVTERQFREWTVHFAGEPMERHRKRPSFAKLQSAFEKEVEKLKEISSRYEAMKQEAMLQQEVVECQPMCPEQDLAQSEASCEDYGLLSLEEHGEHDSEVNSRILHEREQGIRSIQNQVSEVNQMFQDLASVVTSQGEQLDCIDRQAQEVQSTTKEAVRELRKAGKRQAGTRENLCYMLMAAVALLCFLVFPHLHTSSYVSQDLAGSNRIGVLRGSRPEDIIVDEGPMVPEPEPPAVQVLPQEQAYAEWSRGLTEAQLAAYVAGPRSSQLSRSSVQPLVQGWNQGPVPGTMYASNLPVERMVTSNLPGEHSGVA